MREDDPFIVHANIAKLRSLLGTEIDETTRRTVWQLLAEFESTAVKTQAAAPAA